MAAAGQGYYILYVMTPDKGARKLKIINDNKKFLSQILNFSIFLNFALRMKSNSIVKVGLRKAKIKLIVYNYREDSPTYHYSTSIARGLAFK